MRCTDGSKLTAAGRCGNLGRSARHRAVMELVDVSGPVTTHYLSTLDVLVTVTTPRPRPVHRLSTVLVRLKHHILCAKC